MEVSAGVLVKDTIPMLPHVPRYVVQLLYQVHCPAMSSAPRVGPLEGPGLGRSDLGADAAQDSVPPP